ncbi:hypothetical protein [Agrobacterium tumefaciens]|uniref:hypothetical protein n=1 Tax=Agrobacterium tumefaciens TaxID=358 RepID=UPI00224486D0|nr:hypothetical protein [Agrobacterium tumefaciens]MCW8059128.1 hypothetical protein [Agrobacterium tumefaciens]MCW8143370.1 hypothetical protein [Agrobacterium tumefaciens]
MADDADRKDRQEPANDNRPPDGGASASEIHSHVQAHTSAKLDATVLSIARLIGRQMARDDFAALQAANDNRSRRVVDDD